MRLNETRTKHAVSGEFSFRQVLCAQLNESIGIESNWSPPARTTKHDISERKLNETQTETERNAEEQMSKQNTHSNEDAARTMKTKEQNGNNEKENETTQDRTHNLT